MTSKGLKRPRSPPSRNTPRTIDYRRRQLPLAKHLTLLPQAFTSKHARDVILQEKVTVDGKLIIDPFFPVDSSDSVIYVDETLLPSRLPSPEYWLLYKPRHVLTSKRRGKHDPLHCSLITDFLDERVNNQPIMPVGRLDFHSEGLIILTSDGSLNRILTSPEFGITKTYRCLAGRDVRKVDILGDDENEKEENNPHRTKLALLKLLTSLTIQERGEHAKIGCLKVNLLDHRIFSRLELAATSKTQLMVVDIELKSGKNHEVRRLLKSIGFQTFMLCRRLIEGVTPSSVDMPADLEGIVRHMQCEAGVNQEQEVSSQEVSSQEVSSQDLSQTTLLTELDVAWVRECSSKSIARQDSEVVKSMFTAVQRKAYPASVETLRPGGLRRLTDVEIDAMFGAHKSSVKDR